MNTTRSGETVSAQIGKMGLIDLTNDFGLLHGQRFNIKNDGDEAVALEVQLSAMAEGSFIETVFEAGWNPEIVKTIKATSIGGLNLKWGY